VESVRLDDVAVLPTDILARLRVVDSVFQAHEYIDSVVEKPRVKPLVAELEEHLRRLPVRGYHCTREPEPGYFAREGLRLLRAHH
jgi:hypothetical protein